MEESNKKVPWENGEFLLTRLYIRLSFFKLTTPYHFIIPVGRYQHQLFQTEEEQSSCYFSVFLLFFF